MNLIDRIERLKPPILIQVVYSHRNLIDRIESDLGGCRRGRRRGNLIDRIESELLVEHQSVQVNHPANLIDRIESRDTGARLLQRQDPESNR